MKQSQEFGSATHLGRHNLHVVGISPRKAYTELLRLGFVEHQQYPHALWGDCYCYVNSLIVRWRALNLGVNLGCFEYD